MPDLIEDSLTTIAPGTGPQGQLAHPEAIEHGNRLAPDFYSVGDHAWCLVGNGLSNQTFIKGPQGIIAIDTGESIEEMRAALKLLREHTDTPIVACIYTHFHYVNGTRALLEEPTCTNLQIYGHTDIPRNLERFGGEIAPRSTRGIVHQFGLVLPAEGPDGLLHCGLGQFFRNPEHAPFSAGYMPAQHNIEKPLRTSIAGLTVEITPAPSDATDSITIWFPELNVCVNNLVWPSLFNIYAIRGEEYRDPNGLLTGIDAIAELEPQHLICTHGPPISGAEVNPAIIDFRDAIQFLWDQTVRGLNDGLRLDELTARVQLPERFSRSYFTRQFYGLAEHHVRQIHNGLYGWLDEDESHLFPVPETERSVRLIKGFGGHQAVVAEIDSALDEKNLRWAAELATWLVRAPQASAEDRARLARIMREFAQRTPSANVRNWCLTRALALEGTADLARFSRHRFRVEDVLAATPGRFIGILRVLLDPDKAREYEGELAWHFVGGKTAGLKIRRGVALATTGAQATLHMTLSHETWAQILCGKQGLWPAEAEGLVSISGEANRIRAFWQCFDLPSLQ